MGPSGSGKSSVALGLLDLGSARGREIRLVCDDQAILENHGSSLVARAPEPIKGKIEIWGLGIADVPNLDSAEISLVCELGPDETLERMPEPRTINLFGYKLDYLRLPIRHEQQAIRIVLAYLDKNGQ